jgi:NADH-quinone oxidoreductase subunit N
MTLYDLYVLLPLLVLAVASMLAILLVSFYRNHTAIVLMTLASLGAAFASLFVVAGLAERQVGILLLLDDYSLFFIGLIFAGSFAVALLSYSYLERLDVNREELYLLLLLATLGSAVLAASTHFVSFFLGLEILSVSLYAMIAYGRARPGSIESGLKYLTLSATSSAFLLFGMALVYAELGTIELAGIAQGALAATDSPLILTGFAMMVVGIGFKLSVVPFHMWAPDVYQGAPAPVTAFIATVSKGGMFALLLRYFTAIDLQAFNSLVIVFGAIAIASMLGGNLLALLQSNVKRILAYSSIAHLGFMLVAFLATGPLASTTVALYLVAYFVTTLGTFGVITVLSTGEREAEEIEDYRGLFWHRPWLAGAFTAMLLSLAGIPLTVGFIGKLFVVTAGIGDNLWLLVVTLVVASSIGLYYYLRVALVMYMRPADAPATARVAPTWTGTLVLTVLILLLFGLGVYPVPMLDVIQATVAGLV